MTDQTDGLSIRVQSYSHHQSFGGAAVLSDASRDTQARRLLNSCRAEVMFHLISLLPSG